MTQLRPRAFPHAGVLAVEKYKRQARLRLIMALFLPLWCAQADAAEVPQLCDPPLFLSKYAEAGRLRHSADGTLSLDLVADLHAADCGAPDCYGTAITLSMKPEPQGAACVIREMLVATHDFFDPGCENPGGGEHARQEKYVPEGGPINIAQPGLKKLTLRNLDGRRALLLLPDNFLYFEDVVAGGVLHSRLASENDEAACCWGSSSSSINFRKPRD